MWSDGAVDLERVETKWKLKIGPRKSVVSAHLSDPI